jgi:hypothetical protein
MDYTKQLIQLMYFLIKSNIAINIQCIDGKKIQKKVKNNIILNIFGPKVKLRFINNSISQPKV